jgi:hypothetical protein
MCGIVGNHLATKAGSIYVRRTTHDSSILGSAEKSTPESYDPFGARGYAAKK